MDRSDPTTTQPDEDKLANLAAFLQENFGINFPERKYHTLYHRLLRRTFKLKLESVEDYFRILKENDEEIHYLLDEVSSNKTDFFREIPHWDYLKKNLLPEWRNKVWEHSRQPVKIWCMACSSGQEPYTISMLMEDFCTAYNLEPAKCFKILATDLSRGILRRAITAEYTRRDIESVLKYRPDYIPHFFSQSNARYKVKDNMRERITFRQFNLKSSAYPFYETFDLILCRNVLIYFDQSTTQHVIENIERSLKPGGTLFIGHTEHLNGIEHGLQKIQPAIYRKK